MKTNAAFFTLVALTLTTVFAASTASAQLSTSVPRKKTSAVSNLQTVVTPPEPEKSPWSVSLAETALVFKDNTSNFIESDFNLGYALNKDFAIGVYTGYESHFNSNDKSDAYDIQPNISLTNIVMGPIKGSASLLGIIPTARSSQESNASFGYGATTDFSTSLGPVGVDLDSEIYQFTYKSAAVPTPALTDDLSSDKVFGNNSSDAFTILTLAVPLSKAWAIKSGFRYRVKTPLIAQNNELFRFQPKVAFTANANLSFVAGVQWQKDFNDSTKSDVNFFDDTNRVFFFATAISI